MRIEVGPSERAILYVNGQPAELLGPGVHKRLSWFAQITSKPISALIPIVALPEGELIAKALPDHFAVHRIADSERGLLYKEDNLVALLKPGTYVTLKDAPGARLEVVKTQKDMRIDEALRARVMRVTDHAQHMRAFSVPLGHKALLLLDNVLQPGLLEPGSYAFWLGTPDAQLAPIDLREQVCEIEGQELMTQDKVTLRLNLSTRYQVQDPVLVSTSQTDYKATLYRELQLALRAEVSALTLDDLLQKKQELGAAILARAETALSAIGIKLTASGVRDIILPGEMRTIMNQVIEAEKRAAANLIARREETAATRNLMNTARMLEQNPTLMRLKELESAERIAEKIQHLSVYGGLEAFLSAIVPTQK